MGSPPLTRLLLDTHIWIWYLTGSERLPRGIRDLLDRSLEACWLSPISIWEAGMLASRGRLPLKGDFAAWVAAALENLPLREAALNFHVARKSLEIELPHRDPADRLLAATSLVHELTLLTVDQRLTGIAWLPAWGGMSLHHRGRGRERARGPLAGRGGGP